MVILQLYTLSSLHASIFEGVTLNIEGEKSPQKQNILPTTQTNQYTFFAPKHTTNKQLIIMRDLVFNALFAVL